MSDRDPNDPPVPGVNIPSFGADPLAALDPAALQAMLAGGGGGDRGGGGGGPIDMNYQWLRAIIHEGARRACGPPS
jgi:hypothetical protein